MRYYEAWIFYPTKESSEEVWIEYKLMQERSVRDNPTTITWKERYNEEYPSISNEIRKMYPARNMIILIDLTL